MSSHDPAMSRCPVHAAFLSARKAMSSALIERDEEVDLALTALAAGEHLLLVGPPGCAKSMLLDALAHWLDGRHLTVLFTRFTSPEEVFGPVSMRGLLEDRYVRVTVGKLPEADLFFADEIFKASSAILNTLLKVLNERIYDVGDGTMIKVPLKLCVAASNEYPSPETGQELAALFDRFVLRRTVRPITTAAGRDRLLFGTDPKMGLGSRLTPVALEQARTAVNRLSWADDSKESLREVLRALAREGVVPGDRRQRKAVRVAQAYAWLNDHEEVQPEDLEVLASVLWDDPVEQPAIVARVIGQIADPPGMRVSRLLLEAESVLTNTDVKDLTKAATATAKLAEIEKQLAAIKGSERADKARAYVRERIKAIKLASLSVV